MFKINNNINNKNNNIINAFSTNNMLNIYLKVNKFNVSVAIIIAILNTINKLST